MVYNEKQHYRAHGMVRATEYLLNMNATLQAVKWGKPPSQPYFVRCCLKN